MIGRKRSIAACTIDCSGDRPWLRFGPRWQNRSSEIAFFFTDTHQQARCRSVRSPKGHSEQHQREQCADAGGGKVERIVSGWMKLS
jgi:hypothetical protein